jgi:hypothetical protein
MSIPRTTRQTAARPVLEWRRQRLLALGLSQVAAERVAEDRRVDLHALLDLVDRGCPPDVAVRILAPLTDAGERC